MALSHAEIEALADQLLEKDFKDKRSNKSKTTEYPVLSPTQLKRRASKEIPYSSLSGRQKLTARTHNLEFAESEVD